MKDLRKYLKDVGESLVFDGDTLVAKIPMKYESKGLLNISTNVTTLAIFEILVDGEQMGITLPSMIEMEYDDIGKLVEDGIAYRVITLKKGSKFIVNKNLLKMGDLPSVIFREFFDSGYLPKFMSCEDAVKLFDDFKKYCGFNLNVSHVVTEFIVAHLARDSDDLSIKYRYTDMSKPFTFIGLNNIEFGTDSTTAKIIGSNFTKGVNAALTNETSQRFELEDLLRS